MFMQRDTKGALESDELFGAEPSSLLDDLAMDYDPLLEGQLVVCNRTLKQESDVLLWIPTLYKDIGREINYLVSLLCKMLNKRLRF